MLPLTNKLIHVNSSITINIAKIKYCLNLGRFSKFNSNCHKIVTHTYLLWCELICSQHLPLGQRPISIDIHPHEG